MANIIFMGTPDFSVPILRALHETFEVDLVVSQPDKKVGRKQILTPPAVAKEAATLGIEVFQPEAIGSTSSIEKIKSYDPDIIVTAAYGQLLSEDVLNIPKLGCVNVHASLLPRHRGGAPIHRSIIEGDEKTGVTLMYMAKALDAGDIIAQQETVIEDSDTVGTLHDRLSEIGTELLINELPNILNETNSRTPQDDALKTFSPNIEKEDEFVTFDRPSREVFNHIRGLNPFPGSYTLLNGKRLKLYLSKLTEKQSTEKPGTIVKETKDGFLVATNDFDLEITEVQPAGGKRINAGQYIRNNSHLIGDMLGEDV